MKHIIHKLNGYTLILIPNNNKTIHITACIKSGTMNETKENAGIHHLIEHILTEAWKPCGKQTCSSYWEKKGVNMNANTHLSYVNFYVNGLKEDIQIMLNYMFDIIISPFLKDSTLQIEKHAVLNELLILNNNPENKLKDVFNKNFYSNEGLQHTDDYDLQIKNLNKMTMTMSKIKSFYNNLQKEIIFIVCGEIKTMPLSTITNNMKTNKTNKTNKTTKKMKMESLLNENKNQNLIFTYSNKKIHLNYDLKSTIFMMGIPIKTCECHKMVACLQILNAILFEQLRIQMKIIYGIKISLLTLPYYHIIINVTVENKHIVQVYETIIKIFEKYKTEPFPQSFIDGMKQKTKLKYYNTEYTSTYMAGYILNDYLNGEIISMEKKMKDILKMKDSDFIKLMTMNLNHCLTTYQGKIKGL